jgi:TolB protein
MRRLRSVCVAACVLAAAAAAAHAETRLIRTFVNGTGKAVHDMHIEYSQPIKRMEELSATHARFEPLGGAKKVDLTFPDGLAAGASVSLAGTTDAGSLGIQQWWWTDTEKKKVSRPLNAGGTRTIDTYTGTMRGDESDVDLDPRNAPVDDPYSIINKNHHFGGRGRATGEVTVTIDARGLLDIKRGKPKGLDADRDKDKLRRAIEAAAKQWSDCTYLAKKGNVPLGGAKGSGNNENAGPGKEPPVMAPGPSHHGDVKGRKFRSVTQRECDAAYFKYRGGLKIVVLSDPSDTTTHADVSTNWGPLGDGTYGEGPSTPDDSDATKTGSGTITMTPAPPGKSSWHVGEDQDHDGYITNRDGDTVGRDEVDFYSIFKHELGHVLCFYHSGDKFTEAHETSLAPPLHQGAPLSAPSPSEERAPYHAVRGDPDAVAPGVIYFASNRPGGYGGYDLWSGTHTDDGWRVENLGPTINGPGDDVDPVLGSDGTSLVFASNRAGGSGGYDLYRAAFDTLAQAWRAPANLGPNVNSRADERHPSLRADQWTLYFASDRAGGFGGFDVWTAEMIEGGAWAPAQNVGADVNTAANEQAPAVSSTGVALYFASDRAGGFGKLDLWKTIADGGAFSPPVNLGEVVNSDADDTDPAVRLDGAYLDFASDREGGGFDLYQALLEVPTAPPPRPRAPDESAPTLRIEGPRLTLQPVIAADLVVVGWRGGSVYYPGVVVAPQLRVAAMFRPLFTGGELSFFTSHARTGFGYVGQSLITVGGFVAPFVRSALDDRLRVYVLAGFNVGVAIDSSPSEVGGSTDVGPTTGFTVGAGVLYALTRRLGIGLEVGSRTQFTFFEFVDPIASNLYVAATGLWLAPPPPPPTPPIDYTKLDLPGLAKKLGDDDYDVRQAALKELEKRALTDPDAYLFVLELEGHPDPQVRFLALTAERYVVYHADEIKWDDDHATLSAEAAKKLAGDPNETRGKELARSEEAHALLDQARALAARAAAPAKLAARLAAKPEDEKSEANLKAMIAARELVHATLRDAARARRDGKAALADRDSTGKAEREQRSTDRAKAQEERDEKVKQLQLDNP